MKTSKHPTAAYRYKSEHNTGGAKLSGERASVDPETVHSCKEQLSEIMKGQNPCDIYNTGRPFLLCPI